MTMQAVQSALAIRRQRSRREEQRRAKARRHSSQSDNLMLSPSESNKFRGSFLSIDGNAKLYSHAEHRRQNILSTKVMGTVTTFHVGIVFVMLGLMLITSSLVPGYIVRDWQELLGTGCFLVFLGIILIIINRIVSAQEDKQFSKYIKKKLSRAKLDVPARALASSHSSADCAVLTQHAHEMGRLECITEESKVEMPEVHQGGAQAPEIRINDDLPANDVKIEVQASG